jgi:ubiquinone/menaquinone biosynthesis C-methylase UbiE
MSEQSLPYVIHSDEECQRLELQARLANIAGHLRHLPVSSHSRVLDVGCGSGSMSRLIARSFPQAEVVGVDVREQYLDFARARAREEGIRNLRFQSGDVFALPFPDASFDLVWSKYLLQWLREPRSALAEMKRVTKPHGLLFPAITSASASNIIRSRLTSSVRFAMSWPHWSMSISGARWRRL